MIKWKETVAQKSSSKSTSLVYLTWTSTHSAHQSKSDSTLQGIRYLTRLRIAYSAGNCSQTGLQNSEA